MKKNLFILSALIAVTGLTACSGTSDSAADSQESSIVEPAGSDTADTSSFQSIPYDTAAPYYTITVNSTEKVSVIPDIAEVVYSVRTKDSEASGCQQKNSEAVSQVTNLLKDLGIAETSIRTSDYYMNPVYSYSGGTSRLTGYEAVTTLTVSDLPIEDLDNILAQSVSTGINTVQSITYQASQYDQSYQEALKRAVSTAHEKAQVLAAASGASVGSVISIQEISGYSDARYTDYARSNQVNSYGFSAAKEDLAESASIMPGEIAVEAGIVVEYQLIP